MTTLSDVKNPHMILMILQVILMLSANTLDP